MKELKKKLVTAVFNNYDAGEHHVANVKIKDVVIERRLGGKRTAVAEILVDYVEGDSAWVTRLVEFSQEGEQVKIINMKPREGINNTDGILEDKLKEAVEEYLVIKGFNKSVFTLKGTVVPIEIYEGVEDREIEAIVGGVSHILMVKVIVIEGRCVEVIVWDIK